MAKQNTKDFREYQEWLILCEQIKSKTPIAQETEAQKKDRIIRLTSDFDGFCNYYFPHYLDSKFGWFHLKAAADIESDPNFFGTLEWPREHAKSVFSNVFMSLYLYAKKQITGMVVVSANQDKAKGLLGDVQAEFVSNNRWINDYGELAKMGDWTDGAFATTDGIGFWALGRGQSPRGIRKAAKRPNYAVVDDIDDKVIVRNPERVKEAVNWILEDLYGALSIKGSRLVIAGNRIHKSSILAHMVGDVNPEDPKNPDRYHLKVYAFETKTRHSKSDHIQGRPAWKERYTTQMLVDKMNKMGYRSARREYFHEHHEEGNVFKKEWVEYCKPKPFKHYKSLITYCDPSYKETEKGDFKAIITIGSDGNKHDILDIWVKRASTKAMVDVFYDRYDTYESYSRYYMEANFLQDLLLDEFTKEGEARNKHIPIRGDKRSKPNKYLRIENMSPLFERGLIRISEDIRQSPDTVEFLDQLLGFPYGHDDGPDALEGGLYYTARTSRSSGFTPRTGKFSNKSKYKQ